jgi:hypothetical protein
MHMTQMRRPWTYEEVAKLLSMAEKYPSAQRRAALCITANPPVRLPERVDCVAKVESCRALIFGEKLKREEIGDSYSVSLATEAAYEFSARR